MWKALGSFLSGVAAVACVACVDKAPPAPPVDPAMVAENLLTAPPADLGNPVGAVFDGKVTYLGNTIERSQVAPGDKVVITHYWQVNVPPGKDWKVFSHLVGDDNNFANVDLTDMRKGHTSDKWAAGQIIRDPQTFILRKDWRSPTARLVVGIYKKGGHKITDRMDVSGGESKDRALTVATFTIDVSKAAPLPGQLVAKKSIGAINIDGKADDASWGNASGTAAFQTAEGGPEPRGPTSAKVTWDDENLYLFVSAEDDDVSSTYTKNDDTIWKADVIEAFIDADGNGKGYVELQVSPQNVHFDAWFPTVRPQSDLGYGANMKTAVNVRGTLNSPNDDDQGWDAELAIPLAAVKGSDANMAVRIPPQPGDVWKFNVVRADYGKDGKPTAASWNRIRFSDWHSLDRMLTLTFADAAGNTAPPPAPPTPETPPATPPAPPPPATTPPPKAEKAPATLSPKRVTPAAPAQPAAPN
ncbi:MAG TPA: carbohydrate-binding family 9-like protein [Kofleriaceae bacterium]|nr:carbohydrate-binding family 9-like protein [Kofleriaceae bacterium]